MKKFLVALLVIILLLILGAAATLGIAFFSYKKMSSGGPSTAPNMAYMVGGRSVDQEELKRPGSSYKCETVIRGGGRGGSSESSWLMHFADGKASGTWTLRGSGSSGTETLHFLQNEEHFHVWFPGTERTGIKTGVDANVAANLSRMAANPASQFSLRPDQTTSLECEPWVVSQDMMELPADVEFMDLDLFLNQVTETIDPRNWFR